MASWCYMLLCGDGSYYVGCTTNLDQRMGEHASGWKCGYTAKRHPLELVWVEEVQHLDDAIACERRIKGWSRAKKQALIRNDYEAIRRLASRSAALRNGAAGFETRATPAPQPDEG